MENSKRIGLIIFCIIAVLAIVVVAVIVGAPYIKEWWANFNAKDEKPVEEQAKEALESVMDSAILADEEPDELLVATESRSGYEVLSYSETDTGVIVTFLVHAPDLYTVTKDIDENYTFEAEEELKNALIDAIGKAEIVEQEVTIEFEKTDDGYEPILSIEFIDAYYGGILKLYNEKLTEKNQKEAE